MKNRILFLVFTIPIILLIALFSIGKIAGLSVDIPASGISITTQNEDGFINIDRASYLNDIVLSAKVYPNNAQNQGYTFSVVSISGESAISLDNDNRLVVNGNGKAKIVATSKDKGFTDSVIVSAYSSKVFSIKPIIKTVGGDTLEVLADGEDYVAKVLTGTYKFLADVEPFELSDASVVWSSENNDIFEINPVTGKGKAKLSGSTYINAVCPSGVNDDVSFRLKVEVLPANTASGILLNGAQNNQILSSVGTNRVELLVEKTDASAAITLIGGNTSCVSDWQLIAIDGSATQYKLVLNLTDNHPNEITLNFGIEGGVSESVLDLLFDDFSFNVYTAYHNTTDDNVYQKNGSTVVFVADGDIYDADVTYLWKTVGGGLLASPAEGGQTCKLTALQTGVNQLIVEAVKNGEVVSETTKNLTVVQNIQSLEFADNAKAFGIAGVKAVGNLKLTDGVYSTIREELSLNILRDGVKLLDYPAEELSFLSSSEAVKVFPTSSSFKIEVRADGVAEICAKWIYGDYFGADISSKITIQAVNEGVMVSDYVCLRKAAEDGKRVVLNADVMLGQQNMSATQLEAAAYKIKTTYDWQFYANKGEERPDLYYLIEFKNDVYGNGFEINGNNFTRAKDSSGMPLLFKGPLDFASVYTASVKAQDNIVFLVRTKGVVINNVVLKGCSDDSIEDGGMDLSGLNYTGTTLEIMSDCAVLNSRISNGRTAVRVFGGGVTDGKPVVADASDVDVAKEKIKVLIESSIMSNAREFILKIGSNRAIMHGYDEFGTIKIKKFKKADGTFFEPFNQNNIADKYFNDNYLLTDVTLKDCVLNTSGLFSIGMETHFAGEMLAGLNNVTNWTKLAATSYASALRFEGDVKLLDWKKLENVDSSTLIETTSNAQQFLTLDISAMLKKVSMDSRYGSVLSSYDGGEYVHGGIAFYGGGFNYSYLDLSACDSESLNGILVNLSILSEGLEQDLNNPLYLQGTMLPLAAGYGDFKFYMYNGDSKNNFEYQKQLIESGNAFNVPSAGV